MEAGHFSGATCPSAAAAPTLGKTATAYDAEYTTVTDPAGKTRRSRLDGLGRLVRVDEPTGSPPALGAVGSPNQGTSYTYNALDNLTRVTQGAQTRTFAYDSLSRLTSAANPESGTIAYTYDNNGNLTQRTDARGVVTAYTYDRLDRLTRRSYSYTGSETAVSLETTQVDYAYDGCGSYSRGRLCSVTAKKGTTQVSRTAYNRYDALGRVLESTQTTEGQAYTMAYAYDRAGNLIRQRYPSERVVDYVYDGAGRIAGVKTGIDDWYAGGTGSNAVDYEPHGGVKQLLLGNGLWEQRRYNARLQPTRIGLGTTKTTGGLTATGTRPTASLLLLDYSYGAGSNNGNVLSQRIRVGASLNQNQAYTYDALNRLKTAAESGSGAAWSQTYAYDRYGNRRVTAGASHGSNQALTPQSTADIAAGTNRLAGTKGVNLTVAYDGAGNLKADWAANAFKYDGDNRLVAFDKAMGTDSDTTYVYNVGGQLLAEFGGTAPDRPGTRYLTPDHLGSTRVVTGEDQSVLSRHDYLPFGEEIGAGLGGRSSVSGYTASLADGPTQKFTGKERDNESGLDYFGARYYGGARGRFTSVDPENASGDPADPQSWNGYAYARNNPLLYVDPDGRYFIVCQSDGDCTTYAVDSDFYRFLREENLQFDPETDEDGNLLPTNIYSVDERGNRTLYGQATHTRHAPGLEDKGLGPLELALGTGLTSLARKGAASNLWNAARNLFRGKSSSGAKGVQFVAKDGTKITGYTKHGVNRAIGDGGKRTGVKPGKILDALKNPQRIRESVSPDGQPARVFIGKGARVVVNPESGKIVSVNPLSRRRKR